MTFEERIAAEKAIEEVYWRHRIWPTQNPGAKPPLEAVLPDDLIRARVENSLQESNALEAIWHRPITRAHLQAEMDRIAARTQNPTLLNEIFEALGNDPFVIAETLVRRTLSDRLVRSAYAHDERLHGSVRGRAEAALRLCHGVGAMRSMGGEYRETTWIRRAAVNIGPESTSGKAIVDLDDEGWKDLRSRLATTFTSSSDARPCGTISALEETSDAFIVTALLDVGDAKIRTATQTWRKVPFETWWWSVRRDISHDIALMEGTFTRPMVTATCTDDTWRATQGGVPDGRFGHTAVWTGAEMIVWGGQGPSGSALRTGARYDPSTDTWLPTSMGQNLPAERYDHTAVWTGKEMIVWGGLIPPSSPTRTGGRYDPVADGWRPTNDDLVTAPFARTRHTAVWTGTEMIIWGGEYLFEGLRGVLNTGGRYDPSTDSGSPTSTAAGVPAPRSRHTALWTGTTMIVWGGVDSDSATPILEGGRYHPSTDTWSTVTDGASAPSPRFAYTAVWTGAEMIVWGGYAIPSLKPLSTGARYDPVRDLWRATSNIREAPRARGRHTAVWTGTEMIVWGGADRHGPRSTGGRYDPATDSWRPMSTGPNLPERRYLHTAVWTGTEMIVWGGAGEEVRPLATGGRYGPSADAWSPVLDARDVPRVRLRHTAVWTGAEKIVWGGQGREGSFDNSDTDTGGLYDPATDSWRPTSRRAVPSAREDHTAVWTGTEMIVWGGFNATLHSNPFRATTASGGLYDPMTDSWRSTSRRGAPSAHSKHTAVWTGTEMIIWGGIDLPNFTPVPVRNSGGRYNSSSNTWPSTTTESAPAPRLGHTAIWTGARMIVWGGEDASDRSLDTGNLYDPSTDTWEPTSTTNAPSPRDEHTAVWTGSEMIVWGGVFTGDGADLQTGGRYDPSTDSWSPTSTVNAPTGRSDHTAIWTSSEMIVWGGFLSVGSGGRYDPGTDTWRSTSTEMSVPSVRRHHTATWTGTEMIIWGGEPITKSGGLYCACPEGRSTCGEGK